MSIPATPWTVAPRRTPWRRGITTLACVAIGLFLTTMGCASIGGKPLESATIRITPEGTLFLDDKRVPLEQVSRELKSRGATSATGVYIEIPPGLSAQDMQKVSGTLVAGGFPRIIFTKPKSATATAGKTDRKPR